MSVQAQKPNVFQTLPRRAVQRGATRANPSDYEGWPGSIQRKLNNYPYAHRRVPPRSPAEVQDELRRVPWVTQGAINSEAVIDGITKATGFVLPVESEYLRRLKRYGTHILPLRAPECPVGWERHTSLPDKAKEMGVAWVDADGYFCGPPGSSSATKYELPYERQHLAEQIRDLQTEMKLLLSTDGEERRKLEEEKKKKDDLKEKHLKALKENKEKQQKAEDDRYKAQIKRIIKMGDRAVNFIYRKFKTAVELEKEQNESYDKDEFTRIPNGQSFIFLPKLVFDDYPRDVPNRRELRGLMAQYRTHKLAQHKQERLRDLAPFMNSI